ncbi:ribosome biogenesis factor YjgA [Gammaproteobacteria bacterium]|nr:ribosome biogenesis factor YjgA [Gammaproteobacteria bacterium]
MRSLEAIAYTSTSQRLLAPMTEDRPTRSEIKAEYQQNHDLVRQLIGLRADEIRQLPLAAETCDALIEVQTMTKGALARQKRRIAKLLDREDHPTLAQAVATIRRPEREAVRRLHRFEQWRDRLIDGDEHLLRELFSLMNAEDHRQLRETLRSARRHPSDSRPGRTARRKLFDLLGRADDQPAQ